MRHIFRITRCILICLLIFGAGIATAQQKAPAAKYREITWEELVPASWNPKEIMARFDLDKISDFSSEAFEAMKIIAEEWKNAPANPELQDQSVKLPGYVVPLDWEKRAELKEFLLVPYFGACIHVPPPPANQIVYVQLEKPLKDIKTMDTIWVYGKLKVERNRNHSGDMGNSSYSMRADKVEPYKK